MGVYNAKAADGGDHATELGTIKSKKLKELSGIAASRRHPNILWVNNDGDSGLVFAIRTSGTMVAMVSCGVHVEDLEEIAIGPGPEVGADYLYLGDIGDNDRERRAIRIIRFAEPDLTDESGGQIHVENAEEFRLAYPDGPLDAEAFFVDPQSGDLFIVSKETNRARLYTVAAKKLEAGKVSTLKPAGDLGTGEVSAGAIAPDGSHIILRREDRGWLWRRGDGESVPAAMQRMPQKIPVLDNRQAKNGEAVSFSAGGKSYYTVSEGTKQAIYEFALPTKN